MCPYKISRSMRIYEILARTPKTIKKKKNLTILLLRKPTLLMPQLHSILRLFIGFDRL
jgi:hypothetical protein